jgi:hypothetical protein
VSSSFDIHTEFSQLCFDHTWLQTEYARLKDERDTAAYRAVGALDAAIVFCREGKPEDALSVLLAARSRYQTAEDALDELKVPRA